MSLPRKVREAEERAEAAIKQMQDPQGEPPKPPTEEPPPAPETAPPEAPPVDETPPVGSQEQSPPEEDQTWEDRYKVLSGKYSNEVPRLAAERRELKAQLQAAKEQLEALKKSETTGEKTKLISPEEVNEYGEPLIDLIRRAAREEVTAKDAEIADLKARIEAFDSRTTKVVEVDFYDQLGRDVPDWVAINDDKNFHKWLDGYDELTGSRRQDLLAAAEQERDAKRVSNFFKAFKKAGQSWAATASQRLESQTVPESTPNTKPPTGKKIWVRPEIAAFYDALRRGDISPKDGVAIEADIAAAQLEGRIR